MNHQQVWRFLVVMMTCPVVACLAGQQAQDPCAEDELPGAVLKLLEEKYTGWRVESAEDLDAHARQLWLKAHPDKCPGIAVGQFSSRGRMSYALLLIPRAQGHSGYRLLIFTEHKPGRYGVQILAEEEEWGPSYMVISVVPPGEYSDAEGEERARLTSDGLLAERLEVGAILYYWKKGRFNELITSE